MENDAAASQPNEPRTPRLDRLNAVEQELLAALARKSDGTPELAYPAHPTDPPGHVERNPVDLPAAPGAETDVLGLLRALAGRKAGPPQEIAAPPPVADNRRGRLVPTVPSASATSGAPCLHVASILRCRCRR